MRQAKLLLALLFTSSLQAEVTFEPWSFTDADLFPSAIISTATVDWNGDEQSAEDKKSEDDPKLRKRDVPIYGDENGWLAIDFSGLTKGAQVSVEISVDGFLKPSKWQGKVTKVTKEGEARIFPKAAWDYEALLKVRQQRPVNVVFKATINGAALPDVTETYTLKSLNDCPFYVLWDEDGDDVDDFSNLFAAYVNENHPWVEDILKEAIASGIVDSFDGYQSGEPKRVMLQVFAIWNALQRRGIKYSDVSTTTPSKFVVSQSVRFLDESIEATQANCVDGSVLMASILRKIGIESYLVMVPGHCFLAFDAEEDNEGMPIGLETTMLGNNDLKPLKDMESLPRSAMLKEFQNSYKTFSHAILSGKATIKKHSKALESGDDPEIQLVSITDARELGIMPIAFTKDKK